MEMREKMLKFPLLLYILFLALFARSCFARWSQESADIGRFSKGRRPSPSEYLGKRALQKDSRYIVRKLYEVAPYATSNTTLLSLGLLGSDGAFNPNFLATGDGVEDQAMMEVGGGRDISAPLNSREKGKENVKSYKFEVCPPRLKEYIPCLDNTAAINKLKSTSRGQNWERHCPSQRGRMCCLIAAPLDYRFPIRWPKSRDEVWYNNVPHTQLVVDKGGQNWIKLVKDKFTFPGGGTQFAHGASQYLDHIGKILPVIGYGSRTRVALDIGCGVASFGAYLLGRNVITLSIAPKDIHENQIQFALERGLPAMVAALATRRLLYPSQAFDLIHCSRCRIDWTRNDGILLLEVDRVLRAGAYFVWSAQPVYKHEDEQEKIWAEMKDLARRLCWEQVGKDGQIAIWRKAFDNTCIKSRSPDVLPPICDGSNDPDKVWYVALQPCISLIPESGSGGDVLDWPVRLSAPPSRLQTIIMDAGVARPQVFKSDERYWHVIVEGYLRGLGLHREDFRNVMDMRAVYGGFATALVNQKVDWWVMNVVPVSGPNTLPVIYDRGLIGVAHDWCEPFDTYPRTYDLLHAVGLFSLEDRRSFPLLSLTLLMFASKSRGWMSGKIWCNIAHILLEMDRILRPGGWVLVRESTAMANRVQALAKSVRWKTRILETESGPFGKDKLLSCQKQLWYN